MHDTAVSTCADPPQQRPQLHRNPSEPQHRRVGAFLRCSLDYGQPSAFDARPIKRSVAVLTSQDASAAGSTGPCAGLVVLEEPTSAQLQTRPSDGARRQGAAPGTAGRLTGSAMPLLCAVRASAGSHAPAPPPPLPMSALSDAARALVWLVAFKCADLGHLASPREVHRRWVRLLEEVRRVLGGVSVF